MNSTTAKEVKIVIPTYRVGKPMPWPVYYDRRQNQGCSGRVYPNPIFEEIEDHPTDVEYTAIILENEFIEVTVLPEIGGRIYSAVDKANGYDFIYRNRVIKPALIGLLGPWASGGIEFNWPLHHRPSTFFPLNWKIEARPDGGQTVWIGEHEPLHRMKSTLGISVLPNASTLECEVRLFNRTPAVQTFLWWANVAVSVNDNYQVIFPPDVVCVNDHSKRAMLPWPMAKGPYGLYAGYEFQGDKDISWVKNFPLPGSCFVNKTTYDFFAGYDHGVKAGIVYVADHHISTGKKFFYWGENKFAKAWERNLTDSDGPYIELMAGAYTDNQPDFSFLQPQEARVFKQTWFPVRGLPAIKNANAAAAVSLSRRENGEIALAVAVTRSVERARLILRQGDHVLLDKQTPLHPGAPFETSVAPVAANGRGAEPNLYFTLSDESGAELLAYRESPRVEAPLPPLYAEPPSPEECRSNDSLYRTGRFVEQNRHATLDAVAYWTEALRRDPDDVRCLTALGRFWFSRGHAEKGMEYLRRAVDIQLELTPNPEDGEALYYLGQTHLLRGELNQAYDCFYKSTWNFAWQPASFQALADIDCRRGDFRKALLHADRCLEGNFRNLRVRNLKALALRSLGLSQEALAVTAETLALDPMDFRAMFERMLASEASGARERSADGQRALAWFLRDVPTVLDVAVEYLEAGAEKEALRLLSEALSDQHAPPAKSPMIWYFVSYLAHRSGNLQQALDQLHQAESLPPDLCFPSRHAEAAILSYALGQGAGHRAHSYLASYLYENRRHDEAIGHWETATGLKPDCSLYWRNLGIALHNHRRNNAGAVRAFQMALEADPHNARLLVEWDQLAARTGATPPARYSKLKANSDLITKRDDLVLAWARLNTALGHAEEAVRSLEGHHFRPWECTMGEAPTAYFQAKMMLGFQQLAADSAKLAAETFMSAGVYPVNLAEDDYGNMNDPMRLYCAGFACKLAGENAEATRLFEAAVSARVELPVTFSELNAGTYYRARALSQLGRTDESRESLQRLLSYARTEYRPQGHLPAAVQSVFFHDEDLDLKVRIEKTFLEGLALMGLGEHQDGAAKLASVMHDAPLHFGAAAALKEWSTDHAMA
jgi:tetratricopeptide (TPR) repeat protein